MFLIIFGKFSVIISFTIFFSAHFSLLLLVFPLCTLVWLTMFCISLGTCSFLFTPFFLFFGLHNFYFSIFKFADSFFCLFKVTRVRLSSEFKNFSYCLFQLQKLHLIIFNITFILNLNWYSIFDETLSLYFLLLSKHEFL